LTSTTAPSASSLAFRPRGLVLRHAGLDRLRRAVDQVLGFLQAQAGDLADHLDDLDLLAAGFLEDDFELGLLLNGRGRTGRGGRQPPAATAAMVTLNFS
jgi:hypothetical protein